MGARYSQTKTEIDDALIVALAIPATATSVNFGLNRVSLLLEELRARSVGRPRQDAPKGPVQRVCRMIVQDP